MGFGSAYPYWANYGIGSTVSHRQSIPDERSSWLELTWRLVAVTPDKVVLQMSKSSQYHGALVPSSKLPQVIEIPAVHPPCTEPEEEVTETTVEEDGSTSSVSVVHEHWPMPEQDPGFAEGDETIEVAGQAIPCHWLQRSVEVEGQRVTFRTWLSDQIPGGVAGSSVTKGGTTEKTVVASFLKK